MANMSHCRFQNTREDLYDCWLNLDADDLSEQEKFARRKLIRLCVLIAGDYGDELETKPAT